MQSTGPDISLWLRLWQPFFRLSVYGKFLVVLGCFLLGFIVIGLHDLWFIRLIQSQLGQLTSGGGSEEGQRIIAAAGSHLLRGGLVVSLIMGLLGLGSFLCVRELVSMLRDMSDKLEEIRLSDGEIQNLQAQVDIPVLASDEIGEVAGKVNELITDIDHLSRYRRVIEADERTEEIYGRLATVFKDHFHLPAFAIWEVGSKDSLRLVQYWPESLDSEICQLSTADLCRAKRTGEIVCSSGYPGICPIFPLNELMTHTCIPMIVGGQTLGVVQFLCLYVDSRQREQQLANSLRKARQYLRETLPVLHAKRLAENLHELAVRDTLTGLYNRRYLEGNINPLLAGIRRRKTQLGILMCDMDFFKQVNDEHGHEVGDIVLKDLSGILEQNVRSSDLVIRYGGEEFLVLLIDCDPEKSTEVADKLRAAVEEHHFRHEGGVLRKSISIGISNYPEDSNGFWESIKFADIALYKAKEEGRNRVVRFLPAMWQDNEY